MTPKNTLGSLAVILFGKMALAEVKFINLQSVNKSVERIKCDWNQLTMTCNSIAASLIALLATLTYIADEPFKITAKRSDDRIEVKSKDDKTWFVIRSPFGISNANIERTTEQWPDKVVIQLRLKGLENFKLSTDKLKLEASVSSQNGDVRLWKDGKEDSPLDAKSPYWMEIKILDSDGEPTKAIPLKDGYFEMELPKKFFEGNPTSFKVEWVDFYRN